MGGDSASGDVGGGILQTDDRTLYLTQWQEVASSSCGAAAERNLPEVAPGCPRMSGLTVSGAFTAKHD